MVLTRERRSQRFGVRAHLEISQRERCRIDGTVLARARRDNVLEIQMRELLKTDLAIEPDVSRWMALWGAPGL